MKLSNLKISETPKKQVDSSNITISLPGEVSKSIQIETKPKLKISFKKIFVTIISILLIVAISIGGYLYYQAYDTLKKTTGVDDPFAPLVVGAGTIKKDEVAISKLAQTNGRTNVLLLGTDYRPSHQSMLTDSIILGSYNHSDNSMSLISLPRDLRVKYDSGYTKVNAVYPFSYSNKIHEKNSSEALATQSGFDNLSKAVKEVTGLDVHYGVLVNLQGLKDIIDNMGGITVNVERSFTDSSFPNDSDTGTITISFKEGIQNMNGARALQYARSRKGNNEEGSDYQRARRQQIVLNAIREKFVSSQLFNQVDSLNRIIDIVGKNISFYKIGAEEISYGIQSRELLKTLTTTSMVLDPEFGSFNSQLISSGNFNDGIGSVGYPKAPNNSYEQVQKLISFYLANTYFLTEKAEVAIAWTNAKRNGDYNKVVNSIYDKNLRINRNNSQIRVKTPTTTPTPTSTSSASITSSTKTITFYIKDTEKTKKTSKYYQELMIELGFYVISNPEQVPSELQKLIESNDIVMVLE